MLSRWDHLHWYIGHVHNCHIPLQLYLAQPTPHVPLECLKRHHAFPSIVFDYIRRAACRSTNFLSCLYPTAGKRTLLPSTGAPANTKAHLLLCFLGHLLPTIHVAGRCALQFRDNLPAQPVTHMLGAVLMVLNGQCLYDNSRSIQLNCYALSIPFLTH